MKFRRAHSNTEAALFACLSSGWATTTGRLLGPLMSLNNCKGLAEFNRS